MPGVVAPGVVTFPVTPSPPAPAPAPADGAAFVDTGGELDLDLFGVKNASYIFLSEPPSPAPPVSEPDDTPRGDDHDEAAEADEDFHPSAPRPLPPRARPPRRRPVAADLKDEDDLAADAASWYFLRISANVSLGPRS